MQPTSPAAARAVAPDVVRAVAIALVVLLHTAGVVANPGPAGGLAAFWAGNIYDSLARAGVPLFVLLTGWLLLAPERAAEPLGRFFRRRLDRVALPLITWSLVAWVWIAVRDHHAIAWSRFWRELLAGPVFYHLWYVYVLLGLYFAIPLLRPLAAEARPSLRWYTLGLWFVGTAALPLWTWWGGLSIGVPILVVSTYVGYLLAGVWLAATPLSRKAAWESALLFLLAALWTIVATARLTGDEHLNVILYSYDRPNVVVMALVAFVLLTQPQPAAWVARHPRLLAVVRACAASSYGIYLLHPLLLDLLDSGVLGVRINGASLPPFVGIPLLAVGLLLVSLGVMMVARRVPVLGRILGA
ncbi:MAG TPA: acyltransferase family protein [Gemmatimonadales bacterium]|nr:acyltransferase family protein [Gemmatimonadales bacterium]